MAQNEKYDAPSNSEASKKLDERLDQGIKESFPGSDPVSVEVSKYAPGDTRAEQLTSSEGSGRSPDSDDKGPIPGVFEQARDAAAGMTDRLGNAVETLTESGSGLAPRLQKGRQFVEKTVGRNPGSALILAGIIGCGIALVAYEALSKPKKTRRRAYGADEIS